ncbi:MAG: acyl--CoA ligase [Lachnospiraceae bacterium]|nr:acyl--CoA ligase [Lachnospiraceae bacterium]
MGKNMDNYIDFMNLIRTNYSQNTAFEYFDDELNVKSVTYNDFYNDVCVVAEHIEELGFAGKNLGICTENSYLWFVYYYAVGVTGNVAVLLSHNLPKKEHHRLAEWTDVQYMFVSENYPELSEGIEHELMTFPKRDNTDKKLKDMIIKKEDMACVLFSSGTTGNVKGVCLSNENCLYAANTSMLAQTQSDTACRMLCTLPFYHIGAVALATLLTSGGTICILNSPKYFWKAVKVMKPTVLVVVPMYVEMIKKKIMKSKNAGSVIEGVSSITCSGAFLSVECIKLFAQNGVTLINGYGMTETAGMGSYTYYDIVNNKISGKIYDGLKIDIVDNEVVITSKSVMMGYYKNPQETAKILRNGSLYTGDLGYFDENGCLRITGRKKNLIILSNGENISPEEIENELLNCENISECLVYEEDGKIAIKIVKNGKNADEKEIREKIAEYNSSVLFYRQIRNIYFVDELPKNETGKIIRY